VEPVNHFTAFPCGLCPVQFQCEEGGEISPASCRYFTEWLGMRDAAAMEF
jgi:DNA-directed RNA polymerase III subunit RPC6